MCVICMKYRIIIINISLGQILLSYIANPSRTHACTRTHARTHTCHTPPSQFRLSLFVGSVPHNRDGVNTPFRRFRWRSMAGRWFIQINTRMGDPVSPRFWVFFAYKKLLGRTETRTCERMHCQSIRTVYDMSRDDRARIATCSLLTSTDKQTDLRRIIV